MKRILSAAALAFVMSASSAQAHDFSPVAQPKEGQVVKYDRGDAILFSDLLHGTVAISVLPITEYNSGNVTFALSFVNRTEADILIDPDTIKATLTAGKPVRIVTAQDLARRARSEAAVSSLSSALGSFSRATLGSQPTTVTTYGTYGRSTSTVRNPSQQLRDIQQSQQQSINESQDIQGTLAAKLSDIRGTVLQKTTLAAGEADGGTLLIQVPKLKKDEDRTMTLTVNFAGDEHVFTFTMDKFRPY